MGQECWRVKESCNFLSFDIVPYLEWHKSFTTFKVRSLVSSSKLFPVNFTSKFSFYEKNLWCLISQPKS